MSAGGVYHQTILDLASAATGRGQLSAPDARAFLDNPLCGDCIAIEVRLGGGRVAALAHEVKGCLLCRAAASVIGKRAIGASLADVESIRAAVSAMLESQSDPPPGWEELAAFRPVQGHRSRYRCVLLPFEALAEALRPEQS